MAPLPDQVRHVLVRDDVPGVAAHLQRLWSALGGGTLDNAALQPSVGFHILGGFALENRQVYLYHEDDLYGLVIASEHGDSGATEPLDLGDALFGDALFTIDYTASKAAVTEEGIWEAIAETDTGDVFSRHFTLTLPRRGEELLTDLILRPKGAPPPLLEAHLRACKIARNRELFATFVPIATRARRRLDEALDHLQTQGHLSAATPAAIPSDALVGVQTAEAVLARAEAKLRAAALGAELATEALQSLLPANAPNTIFVADQKQGEVLVQQASVEARYNAAARHAAEGVKPLAQSIRSLSQERQQAEQNRIAEQRNNLTILSTALTGFVVTLLAGIQTFTNDPKDDLTHWPKIIAASLFVAAVPVIFGRWAEKKLTCPWVRSAIAAMLAAGLWWALQAFWHPTALHLQRIEIAVCLLVPALVAYLAGRFARPARATTPTAPAANQTAATTSTTPTVTPAPDLSKYTTPAENQETQKLGGHR